ncbi:MAG: DUF1707 domain-containing protein [Actinomycetota bacterium]|nr:DUF1707 domain-containing protein [Actinomycetota bacterium]
MTGPSEVWSSFDHDPRTADNAGLRASDADRDVIRHVLATAYADGRLDRQEFDERSDAVASARTLGELPPVIADLVPERAVVRRSSGSLVDASPDELRKRAELAWESERRNAIVGFVGASLVCWAIWIATSFGDEGFEPYFPWPLIVMAVSLANAVRTLVAKEDSIRDELRRLERKQAEQLRPKDPEA